MSNQYDDLYVRDNLRDTGIIPSTGENYLSPDIIPYQEDALSWDTANSTYSQDIAKSVTGNRANNIYVRAKNLRATAETGIVNLYRAEASLFLTPNTWIKVGIASGTYDADLVYKNGEKSIPTQGIAIGSPAFVIKDLTENHPCLITVVNTPAHKVNIPVRFASNSAFEQWVRDNPAVAHRNICYYPGDNTKINQTMSFGNLNQSPEYFIFRAEGQGFDMGTKVRLQCTDQAWLYTSDELALPAPNKEGKQIVTFAPTTPIPASFRSTMMVTLTAVGSNFPAGATLSLNYYQIPNTAIELDKLMMLQVNITRHQGYNFTEDNASLIPLGSCTIEVKKS
jgi:hypothetical protein